MKTILILSVLMMGFIRCNAQQVTPQGCEEGCECIDPGSVCPCGGNSATTEKAVQVEPLCEEEEGTKAPGCPNPYYGYTIGLGLTAASAEDMDLQVQQLPLTRAKILIHKCNKIGQGTSCGWGGLFCVSVTTFKCCNE